MIINPSLPDGYATFCDDIRHEMGGKVTFVGIYNSEMTIQAVAPVLLPKLGVAMAYRDASRNFPQKLTFRITRAGDGSEDLLFETEVDAPAFPIEALGEIESGSVPYGELKMHADLAPITFTGDCDIKARVYRGADEIRLGRLRVRIQAPDSNPAVPT